VEELARVLNKMGAHIRGAGTSLITIEGVDELHPIDHAIIPDRIEAGTLMVAAAITRGNVLIRDCMPEHLDAVIAKLRAAGVEVSIEEGGVRVVGRGDFKPTDIATRPHPGFSHRHAGAVHGAHVAGQGPVGAVGKHLRESLHARARADAHGRGYRDRRPPRRGARPVKLKGAKVMATDLRASACLVLAGLVAEGTTEVLRVYHLDRGYDHLERKLRALAPTFAASRASCSDGVTCKRE
jgi:UDP-N-acetylglucosamine 1-carboxyvinyltransferase